MITIFFSVHNASALNTDRCLNKMHVQAGLPVSIKTGKDESDE